MAEPLPFSAAEVWQMLAQLAVVSG